MTKVPFEKLPAFCPIPSGLSQLAPQTITENQITYNVGVFTRNKEGVEDCGGYRKMFEMNICFHACIGCIARES